MIVAVAAAPTFWIENDRRAAIATGFSVEIDLRPYALTRGPQERVNLPPLALRRGHDTLTVRLPIASEAGTYDVQVLDSGVVKASTAGEAVLRDHVTTLQVTMDLASLSPGVYELTVRRRGDGWQYFPAQVR